MGGNHAGFGFYNDTERQVFLSETFSGFEQNDGTATLDRNVQARLVAYALAELASRPP